MKEIHVLNGDSLLHHLPPSISGEKIVFRECLVYGPVTSHSFEELVQVRQPFLDSVFPGSDYQRVVVPELEKLTIIPSESEVSCWFEEDLFCQVNFWCSIALISKITQNIKLVLPRTNLEYGFAGLEERGLLQAKEAALSLTRDQIQLLSRLWDLFAHAKTKEALALAQSQKEDLPFLLPAVQAWVDSTPREGEMGLPKRFLSKLMKNPEIDSFGKAFRTFHHQLPIYGYGDAIVKILWNELKDEGY
ncbi:DUF1835 domain-containing protein [Algoriphagus namhaensis]|uniref:DUF1835 domain-containing protein n=1 Tax=Algoriphagus namhaensis TaxID=915353 RepID=A0ABV8AWC2_9BACT